MYAQTGGRKVMLAKETKSNAKLKQEYISSNRAPASKQ